MVAEPLAKPPVTAVEAELMADLEARNLKPGGILYAKVTAEWNGLGCVLRQGAVLEAKVVSVVAHSATSKASEVALAFTNAQCGQSEMQPFALTLAAVAVPEEDDSSVSMDMPRALGSAAPSQGPPSNFRSMTSTNADIWDNMQHWVPVGQVPKAGGVYGIKGLKLSVGTGPEDSSVLSSRDRNVALDKHTVLFLLPEAMSTTNGKTQGGVPAQPSASSPLNGAAMTGLLTRDASGSKNQPGSQKQPREAADGDADACAPPDCSIDLPMGEQEGERHTVANISIQGLGYTSRLQKEMAALNHDESLTYLGPTELLVTFNPHPLVPRHGLTNSGSTVRVIRAALVDVNNRKVIRTVDWNLADTKQYLWLLAHHRVLVHVGSELRVYGSGLKVETTIPLDGALSFVRTDPAGKTIAFGIIHERHTPELHAKLQEGQQQEPEEDVQIRVLNEKFDSIATAMSTSGRMPPTLLNEGEVKLLLQRDKRIHLVMHTWDNQWRSLARFDSSCTPLLSSMAPDLLFIVTCDGTTGGREYRVMRPDGKLILRGESSLAELGHAAIGNEDTKEFAVKIVNSNEPVLPGTVFRPADLEAEQLGVYRAADGKRSFSVRVSDPTASDGGYALAPDGNQLAVLTRDRIDVYALPHN